MYEGCGGLQGDTEVTPRALFLMLARRRRRAALESRNIPRGPKNIQKGLTQQSTGGRGHVGAAGGRPGVYKYKSYKIKYKYLDFNEL